MTSAAMAFMRDHGVLKDIYSESTGTAHKTAKGTKVSVHGQGPGLRPQGRTSLHPAVHDLPQAQGTSAATSCRRMTRSSAKSRWTRRKPRPTAIWRVG